MTFVGGGVEGLCGFTPAEIIGAPVNLWIDRVHPGDQQRMEDGFRTLASSLTPLASEFQWQRKDGAWIWLRLKAVARQDASNAIDGLVDDITAEKLLEEQVRQLQKMDAVGQFTGGIAHDFNNLLAVILANDTLLLDALPGDDPRRAEALGILAAAEKAAALTQQLLAFTRRHAYDPRVVDVNAIVAGIERLLRRVIDDDIELSIVLADGLDGVKADPSQLEQIIMNLAINARDAMPAGGKLSIETAHVDVGREYGAGHVSAVHGAHVMLSVSDTGCGMDADTRRRAFDPFFTTKAPGEGTGLGLTTCAGIVKQMGGHIRVDSEPGCGTVVTVLVPRIDRGRDAKPEAERRNADRDGGSETILVVEDDPQVRGLVCRTLERLGYRVLSAATGQDALAIACSDSAHVDLVLSDVVVPDLSGMEIVSRVQGRSRCTKALFMSGHIDHVLLRDGALQAGSHFIQKPFMPQALGRKIREVLDAQ
jgi:PAS domain S-box-containing protein